VTPTRATALLRLADRATSRARRHVNGHAAISRSLGDLVAAWAYADKGSEPGQRARCEAQAKLESWRSDLGAWALVLAGLPGTGKTISAARYVADRGGLMISASSADGWGFGGGPGLRRAQSATLLLIDDLGCEETVPGIANVQQLLGTRAARGAPTVVTTMLLLHGPGNTIQGRYGDHVESRLRPHFRLLAKRDRDDRRSDCAPATAGIASERRILAAERRVRQAAARALLGTEADEAIERLAELVGVTSAQLDDAQAREISCGEEIDRMAETTIADLEASVVRASEEAAHAEAEALAWLDALADLQIGDDQ